MTIARHQKKKRLVIFFACACLFGGFARADDYRPPRNPHYKKKAKLSPLLTTPVHVTPIDRLAPGRWKPDVKLALEVFAADHGKTGENYDPAHPPVAVLAWDDAAIKGDIGEAVFQRLVERAQFKFDDQWWDLVPLAYGRQRTRAAQEQFIDLSTAVWSAQPTYHQYWKYMLQSYQDSCRKVDRKDCRMYLTRLLRGFTRDEAIKYAKDVLADEEARPLATERVPEAPDDPAPARIRRGLREIPEMKDLCRLLLSAGFDVWVVDLESTPLLLASTPAYGIDPSRVIGIKPGQYRDRLLSKLDEPIPTRAGKVEAVVAALGRPPALVVGASNDDKELLTYGSGLRLLLDRGDGMLRDFAQKAGWLVQPAFSGKRPAAR